MPLAVKRLRGERITGRLNEDEPVPPGGAVTMPTWLSKGAAAVWARVAPVCEAMGTLTAADVEAMGMLCTLQAMLEQATDEATILRGANALRQYYALFGLEPVSRSRIHVAKPDEPVSKWAGLR